MGLHLRTRTYSTYIIYVMQENFANLHTSCIIYTICNKHYLQWQKAIMPFTDLQRNFPTKQVHLQFKFPIKNVEYWESEIVNIYSIYTCICFLGNNACYTRNHIYLDISWYNTSYSHSRDIPDCQSNYYVRKFYA